jgi:hypothetical protein
MAYTQKGECRNTGRTHIRNGQRLSISTEFGNIPVWNKGKKLSNEHIEHLKGKRPRATGLNNHRWNGGISTEHERIRGSLGYKLWQDSVKNRDSNCCQKCGEKRVSKLMAHHILNFASHPELRLAIDNGITFCRTCHKKFHLKYSFRNNDRIQVNRFLTDSWYGHEIQN